MIITTPPEYVAWREALYMTESENRPQAWGDFKANGLPLAVGRWQMHPVFVIRWLKNVPTAAIGDGLTWDDLFDLCLKAFWDELRPQAFDGTALAMWFHLHGGKGSGWDPPYGARFDSFYKKEADGA